MSAQSTFLVLSRAGAQRDLSKDSREQPYWDEHGAHIDRLTDEGFIVMGGPLADEGGALLIVRATDEEHARATVAPDPWYAHGILELERIVRWEIFIDRRE